jgi:hypothetical protein
VGYDLHISRALQWTDSGFFPIPASDVVSLVELSADLTLRDEAEGGLTVDCLGWSLRYAEGELSAKQPPDPVLRRMLDLAAELDAWVTGDDGEVYERDGGSGVRRRERDEEDLPGDPLYLSRDDLDADPISNEEWLAAAGEQADFRIDTTIRAKLPSGVAWIPCPPVACWTGHPSGDPVWCFHDEDLVEVRGDDPDTVRRMTALAVGMGAEVLRWDGQPAR